MGAQGNERIWFYYAREKQVGPLKETELLAAIAEGLIGEQDYVYREGFPDWKALRDVPELQARKSSAASSASPQGSPDSKRNGARVPIHELVVAHNDAHVATGHISNISVSGVYFETSSDVFSLNDEVKITLKEGRGLGKPMHLQGVVVRQSKDKGITAGYGLELRGLDEAARGRILDYIKRHQAS